MLKKAATLPANIQTMMTTFQDALKPEQQADPRFAFRMAFLQKIGKASNSDVAVQFIKADSEEAKALAATYILKEVEKPTFTPGDIVQQMKKEGFLKFTMHDHMKLWQELDAKKSGGLGRKGNYKGTWLWFEPWVERVRAHCQEHAAKYK